MIEITCSRALARWIRSAVIELLVLICWPVPAARAATRAVTDQSDPVVGGSI